MTSIDDAPAEYFRNRHPKKPSQRPFHLDDVTPAVSSDCRLREWIKEDLTSIIRSELSSFQKELQGMLRVDDYLQKPSGINGVHMEKPSVTSSSYHTSMEATPLLADNSSRHPYDKSELKSDSNSDIQAIDMHQDSANGDDAITLFKAVEAGDEKIVLRLLEARADPNSKLSVFNGKRKTFSNCSLLSVAVLAEKRDLFRKLVDYNACVNSAIYGFTAGSIKMIWSGGCLFAPIVKGNLDFLQEIVDKRADPNCLASNNATLIWQACYFGQSVRMLSYLLEKKVDCDIRAQSQDIEGVTYSPLHMATLQGHFSHVEMLLKWKSNAINTQNEECNTPLADAIRFVHPDITRLLVSHGARFVELSDDRNMKMCAMRSHASQSPTEYTHSTTLHATLTSKGSRSSLHTYNDNIKSPLQLLFVERNPVLVHAVAEGLKSQEQQVASMESLHVRQFLQTADSNGRTAILKAVFRPRDVVYRGSRAEKIPMTTAMLKKTTIISDTSGGNPTRLVHLNVVESAWKFSDFTQMFMKREQPKDQCMKFLHKLLPRTATRWTEKEYQMTSVTVVESLIPDFHHDLRILREIKNVSSFDTFLSTIECRAVIESNWNSQKLLVFIEFLMHSSLLLVYVGIVFHLNQQRPCKADDMACKKDEQDHSDHLWWLATLGIPFVILECLLEAFEFITHAAYGWQWDYVLDVGNWKDWCCNTFDSVALINFLSSDIARAHDYFSRLLFAICCFIRWNKMLYCLTPFRRVGFNVMPILFTMRDIGPFIFICLFYFFGLGHSYIAMQFTTESGLNKLLEVMYFGMIPEEYVLPTVEEDHDQQSVSGEIMKVHEYEWHRYTSRVFALVATFFLPIALMNILIAAMNNSYSRGVANMERLYQSRVANCVFSHKASTYAAFRIISLCRTRHQREHVQKYLWVCYEKDDKAYEDDQNDGNDDK